MRLVLSVARSLAVLLLVVLLGAFGGPSLFGNAAANAPLALVIAGLLVVHVAAGFLLARLAGRYWPHATLAAWCVALATWGGGLLSLGSLDPQTWDQALVGGILCPAATALGAWGSTRGSVKQATEEERPPAE